MGTSVHPGTRRLGTSDLEVSVVGLGGNNFGRRLGLEATRAVVAAALRAGVTFIDTADVYGQGGGSERLLGEVLEGRRDEVVLATKFGMEVGDLNGPPAGPRGSRAYVRQALEGSLRRLRTDRVDLLQLHEPDGLTPIGETLAAIDELVDEGKVLWAGISNAGVALLDEAAAAAQEGGLRPFVSVQDELSLLRREAEAELLPACERLGTGFLPYFPLASGLLTGKYRRGEPAPEGTRLAGRGPVASDERFALVERLARFAGERGLTLLDVAIGGLAARRPVASVIAGATRPEQVEANARAGAWAPTGEDLAELDRIAPGPRPAS